MVEVFGIEEDRAEFEATIDEVSRGLTDELRMYKD